MSLWQDRTLTCANTKCPDCLQATHCPAFRNLPTKKPWGAFTKSGLAAMSHFIHRLVTLTGVGETPQY
jgi:hypothetical protein